MESEEAQPHHAIIMGEIDDKLYAVAERNEQHTRMVDHHAQIINKITSSVVTITNILGTSRARHAEEMAEFDRRMEEMA